MDQKTEKTVLITGTSSGFGKLTALSLARRGHQVFASMRNIAGKNRAAADELRRIAESEQVDLQKAILGGMGMGNLAD
jgi:NAD(P)-dependent dehydrogenase (short-subunit alcohol dehydrogenase family)